MNRDEIKAEHKTERKTNKNEEKEEGNESRRGRELFTATEKGHMDIWNSDIGS